jgi:hypothetical protein
MAAQARLFYPVRCAAISRGPPSPAYPKHLSCPNSLCRQSVISQNEPNFQKTKMNLIPCSEMTYEGIYPLRRPEKRTQSNPIFELAPRSVAQIPAHAGTQRITGHACPEQSRGESRACPPKPEGRRRVTSIDFAKRTQFAKMRNKPKPMSIKDL